MLRLVYNKEPPMLVAFCLYLGMIRKNIIIFRKSVMVCHTLSVPVIVCHTICMVVSHRQQQSRKVSRAGLFTVGFPLLSSSCASPALLQKNGGQSGRWFVASPTEGRWSRPPPFFIKLPHKTSPRLSTMRTMAGSFYMPQ